MGFPGEDGRSEIDFHIKFSEVSQKGSWAIAHELGHNVQWLTGFQHLKYHETTNNFWAYYCYEKVSSNTQINTFVQVCLYNPSMYMFCLSYRNNSYIKFVHDVQLVPDGTTPRGDQSSLDEQFREWVQNGKPEDKFDHTFMGLDMMTIPTKYFGWEGITETMKKVFTFLSNQ